ncbi:MAG: sugar phosphate isomerase/epimerase [Ruminococcaceae bacterium]|nr:sugar phosphate isomerase/epimerase [Oscillospiraceae bacterium]
MKKLRISSSLNLHTAAKEDPVQYIRAGLLFHREAGFDAADCGINLFDLDSDAWHSQVEQVLASTSEIGVPIELCHLPFIDGGGEKDAAYMERFNARMHRAIDVATALGVKYAVMHPNAATMPLKRFDRTAQYDRVMSHLAPFAEHAAQTGLNVVVENMRVFPGAMLSHRYCQDPDELCDIADALGIGVCWDFGHANISGIKQSEGLAYVGKRLKVLHVNDNGGIDDEHIPPFTGNVDWRDAMHGLAEVGFDGLLNYELATNRLPASLRREFAAYIRRAADELISYIE